MDGYFLFIECSQHFSLVSPSSRTKINRKAYGCKMGMKNEIKRNACGNAKIHVWEAGCKTQALPPIFSFLLAGEYQCCGSFDKTCLVMEVAQWGRGRLCKHEDTCPHSQHLCKVGVVEQTCSPRAVQGRGNQCWGSLTSQPS